MKKRAKTVAQTRNVLILLESQKKRFSSILYVKMRLSFIDFHILALLKKIQNSSLPLDLSLRSYFRSHKSLGAHDRRCIGDTLYGMTRWRSLLEQASSDPKEQLLFYQKFAANGFQSDLPLTEATRLGVSSFLYEKLLLYFGKEETAKLCQLFNERAPTTVRANLLKTSREALLERWRGKFSLSACLHAPFGIHLHERVSLFSLPEFKEGLFEVQDEGSQLIASLVQAKPGDLVLDFCSGSGGKALAFAPSMEGRGQIYLHDVRLSTLGEARRRLRRAGVQNAQFLPSGHRQLAALKGKCNWVLVDVPCSGTGTLRRNPDQKWRIDEACLQRVIALQREIIAQALPYLHRGGRLVYATCSLLPEENEDQMRSFLNNLPLVLEVPPLSLLPQSGGMDGFFAAVFRKKESLVQ